MPKRSAETYADDDGFVVDGDAETKRAKKSSKNQRFKSAAIVSDDSPSKGSSKDENGDAFWPINTSGMRRVTLNQFKGKWMVNLREYYEQDGVKKPGKKGISLPLDQFAALIKVLPEIDTLLRENGESIPRPNYNKSHAESNADDGEDIDMDGEKGSGRLNHEATSDEDE